MCAEVLVPHVIEATYIEGVIVSMRDAFKRYVELGLAWPVELDPEFFYLPS